MLKFQNPTHFRQIITCSVLSERPVVIESIRRGEPNPGLYEHEVTFLKLIEKITNGTKVQIDESGTRVKFYPGVITNNDESDFEFDCGVGRSLTYFLEPLLVLALFGKSPLMCALTGITNDALDISIDTFIHCTSKLPKHFGVEGEVSVKIMKRGFRPEGGGEVRIRVPSVKKLNCIKILDEGLVKRVRGTAAGNKINPQLLNRIVTKAREVLNDYLPDVWIYTDLMKSGKGGPSSGYSVNLIAETNKDMLISSDEAYEEGRTQEENMPETLGEKIALRLLDELLYSGVVDTTHQWLVLLMMAISEKKVSTIKLGRVSDYTITFLRNLRKFFGIKFQIKTTESKIVYQDEDDEDKINEELEDEEEKKPKIDLNELKIPQNFSFSCVGIGLSNMSRQAY